MRSDQRDRTKRDTLNLRRAAEEALLDRTALVLDPKAYADFLKRLDAPTAPNERLRPGKDERASAAWRPGGATWEAWPRASLQGVLTAACLACKAPLSSRDRRSVGLSIESFNQPLHPDRPALQVLERGKKR
jgi:hypothetical protein